MARKTRKHSQKNASVTESSAFDQTGDHSLSDRGDQEQLPQENNQPTEDHQDDRRVIDAVESNTQLLQQLLEQFSCLQEVVAADEPLIRSEFESSQVAASELDAESEQLRDRIEELENQVAELEHQNSDLASRIANSNVRQVVSTNGSDSNGALCWEDRKQLILQQMEEDTFDADAFVADLQSDSADDLEGPIEFVERLSSELERLAAELAKREDEAHELRCLLDDQSETRDGGIAIGAAAIAGMIDENELVVQERLRLQMLQAEWEERFRQGEIKASLERAKLSRERQELAKTQADLEEKLEHFRRESRHSQETGSGTSRRWLAKLGLNDDDKA
jgi:predicted  nucleic acid-binding Zn-ribbon protein